MGWGIGVSPIVCGYIVKHTGNWNLAFYVTAGAYLLGAFCWLGMDPVTPLEWRVFRPPRVFVAPVLLAAICCGSKQTG